MPDPTDQFETSGLDVRARTAGHTVVVTADGEIDVATAPLLGQVLDAALVAGCRRVVLDAERVTFMGASGVCPLVEFERGNGAGSVLVRNPSPPVRRLLQLVDRGDLVEHLAPTARILRPFDPSAVDGPLVSAGD